MVAKRLLSLAFAVLIGAAGGASGAEKAPRGVVELFTSQGCSSCPPADSVLAELARSGDVVALGYHVGYWDYLGWRDTLSQSDFTKRQYDYGRAFGATSVYTPQAIVNGQKDVNGAAREAVLGALAELQASGHGLKVAVSIQRRGDSLIIDAAAGAPPHAASSARLVLVSFDPVRSILITRGENRGRTIDYVNPVTDIQTVGMWHGLPTRIELPRSEVARKGQSAVLLQETRGDGLPGAILGAAVIGPDEAQERPAP